MKKMKIYFINFINNLSFSLKYINSIMSFFNKMTLYDRVTTCTLAMRYTHGEKSHISSHDEVMKYSSCGDIHDKIKKIIQDGFKTPETRKEEAKILTDMTIELSKDTKNVIVLEFYKRLEHVDDFQMEFITKIFKFSTIDDEVLSLLDNALSPDKNTSRKIKKHLRREFFNIFFGIIENNIKNGIPLNSLGYKTFITKDQLSKLKEIVKSCMSVMIRKWGSCFIDDYFTTEDVEDNFSGFSFNRKAIDVSSMTSDNLMESLVKNDMNKYYFIESLFTIMSFTYDPIIKVDQNIKSDEVREFFRRTVLGKNELKHLLMKTQVIKSSTIEDVEELNIKICKLEEKNAELEENNDKLEENNVKLKERIGKLEDELEKKTEKYKSDIKTFVFEKAELKAAHRDISDQLDRKRKFCIEHHVSKTVEKKQITKFDLFEL